MCFLLVQEITLLKVAPAALATFFPGGSVLLQMTHVTIDPSGQQSA